MDELQSSVDDLVAHIADLDEHVSHLDDVGLAVGLDCRSHLALAAEGLRGIRERLDDLIGEAMCQYRVVVPDHGQIERHKKKSRTQWDKDLYRAVLDTVLVDEETGEITPETPVEKLLHVWNLGVPRTTALKARGLDPDEWATVEERPGWTIRQF